jgi:hypothetical protein
MAAREQQPRLGTCQVVASARLRGDQEDRVTGVTAVASPTGGAHIAVRIGGVLLYLEDRAAFEALWRAVARAEGMADAVYGSVETRVTRAKARARREFEQGRRDKP